MKNILFFLFGGFLIFTSCVDEDLAPIITFDQAAKGAYVKLVEESDRGINLFDITGSVYTYSVEFIDSDNGNLVAEYRLDVTFKSASGSQGPTTLRSYTQSDMTTNENGLRSISNIVVTANELISLMGVNAEDLVAGDLFQLDGNVITVDGDVFTFTNSSAAVNGSAFAGHFRQLLTASCPTSLAGTYDYTVISSWCGGLDCPDGQVTFTLTTSGYNIDDFSMGAYNQCYSVCSGSAALPLGSLRMVDVCNKIEVTGASQWDEVYTWHSMVVDGNDLIIEWTNDYGEGGTTAVHNPAGWPPLELK